MVADKVVDMVADKKNGINDDNNINMEIELGERDTGLVNWARTFSVEAYPACASSKLCEFIETFPNLFSVINTTNRFRQGSECGGCGVQEIVRGSKVIGRCPVDSSSSGWSRPFQS